MQQKIKNDKKELFLYGVFYVINIKFMWIFYVFFDMIKKNRCENNIVLYNNSVMGVSCG